MYYEGVMGVCYHLLALCTLHGKKLDWGSWHEKVLIEVCILGSAITTEDLTVRPNTEVSVKTSLTKNMLSAGR